MALDPVIGGSAVVAAFLYHIVQDLLLHDVGEGASNISHQLGRLVVDHVRLAQGKLPHNHDLRDASLRSFRAAAHVFGHALGRDLEPDLPVVAALLRHIQNGTLFAQPLVRLRESSDKPAAIWVSRLLQASGDFSVFSKFHDELGFEDGEMDLLLRRDIDLAVQGSVHAAFQRWAAEIIGTENQPVHFVEYLTEGFPLEPGAPQRVTFFQVYCLEFKEQIKHNRAVEAILTTATLANLKDAIRSLASNQQQILDRLSRLDGLEEQLESVFSQRLETHFSALTKLLRADHQRTQEAIARLPDEVVRKLQEHGLVPSSVARKLAPSRLFGGKNMGSAHLLGREADLRKIDAAWSGIGRKSVMWIVAFGGVGKTSLVSHWAANCLASENCKGIEAYFDWSFYSQGLRRDGEAAGPASVASADLFFKEALEFFGEIEFARSGADARQKGERLAQVIASRRTLLILDGLEPLQDPVTGAIHDEGLRTLLRTLAPQNRGLCLITTRLDIPDLPMWQSTAVARWDLLRLSDKAGSELLTALGVSTGTEIEKQRLSSELRGHALTLTLLGRYLKRVHRGDIRRVDRINFANVNDQEQGGHAFRVIAAYESWFQETGRQSELAILRLLGLFDRPAPPDCIAALCRPPIAGLNDALAAISEDGWNRAISCLTELDLVEEETWAPRYFFGYDEEAAQQAWEMGESGRAPQLGLPIHFEGKRLPGLTHNSLSTHALIREYFAQRLRDLTRPAWREAHSRLFRHLQASVPFWPEGLDALQPLYQSLWHACSADLHQEALETIYIRRIRRGFKVNGNYSTLKLGAFASDLAAIRGFFKELWHCPHEAIADWHRSYLIAEAAFQLRALGRMDEACLPMWTGAEMAVEHRDWQEAARRTSNLVELELALGDIGSAVRDAHKSTEYADKCGDPYERMARRTTLADALNQSGESSAARIKYLEAEQFCREYEPRCPELCMIWGFRYCDLLLGPAEQAAWRAYLFPESITVEPAIVTGCAEARRRAEQSSQWRTLPNWRYDRGRKLDASLDDLTLGRAKFYQRLIERAATSDPPPELERGLAGLRRAGQLNLLPLGLLSVAWLRMAQGKPRLAIEDLDEAWHVARCGPMRLHLADIHLYRARLFFREQEYPWESPREDLDAAAKLIDEWRYRRRSVEVTDLRRALDLAAWPVSGPEKPLANIQRR